MRPPLHVLYTSSAAIPSSCPKEMSKILNLQAGRPKPLAKSRAALSLSSSAGVGSTSLFVDNNVGQSPPSIELKGAALVCNREK